MAEAGGFSVHSRWWSGPVPHGRCSCLKPPPLEVGGNGVNLLELVVPVSSALLCWAARSPVRSFRGAACRWCCRRTRLSPARSLPFSIVLNSSTDACVHLPWNEWGIARTAPWILQQEDHQHRAEVGRGETVRPDPCATRRQQTTYIDVRASPAIPPPPWRRPRDGDGDGGGHEPSGGREGEGLLFGPPLKEFTHATKI